MTLSEDTLIYILQHDGREAAQQSWDAFRNDPVFHRCSRRSAPRKEIVR